MRRPIRSDHERLSAIMRSTFLTTGQSKMLRVYLEKSLAVSRALTLEYITMPYKVYCFGRTYSHRHWFRENGFQWDSDKREWWKIISMKSELLFVEAYSKGRFKVGLEQQTAIAQKSERGTAPDQRSVNTDEGRQKADLNDPVTDPPIMRAKKSEAKECVSCGDTISAARLKAVPSAIYCVECAASRESDYKRKIVDTWGDRDAWRRDRASWKRNS